MEELLEFIGDNPQGLEKFNQIKEQFGTLTQTAQDFEVKSKDFETKFNEAVASRDKVKNTIRETLGIDEISKDAIVAKLGTLGDTEIKSQYERQIEQLKGSFGEELDNTRSQLNQYESQINDLKMQNALATTDVMGQVKGKYAAEQLLGWIKEGAEFDENGNITYRDNVGATVYNTKGEPLTLEDRIADIKADKDRDFIFETRFLSGAAGTTPPVTAGTPAASIDGGKLVRSQMDFGQKQAYREKYGEEAYQKLPLV